MNVAETGDETGIGKRATNDETEILTHGQIWLAIDQLASNIGSSTSGLARKAGLDPTSLNKSKRFTSSGRERWPSTESLAKILKTTNTPVDEFLLLGMVSDRKPTGRSENPGYSVPMVDMISVSELPGRTVGEIAEKLDAPDKFLIGNLSDKAFAIELRHEVAGSAFRFSEIAVVDPDRAVGPRDRVIVKTKKGKIFKSILIEQTQHSTIFVNYVMQEELFELLSTDIEWIARIAFSA